jgi:hypothetical protein
VPAEAFPKRLLYCALQHFKERETINIFDTICRSLMPGGTFLIGDIPDIDRLFVFFSKPEWVKAYFDSVKNNTPQDLRKLYMNKSRFTELVIDNQKQRA